MSRKSDYTQEKGERFAALYASGKTMEQAFKAFPEGPQSYDTVVRWEENHLTFAETMRIARMAHAEALADGLDEMIDGTRDPQLARVKLDARKWRASKMSRRFADKVAVQVEQTVSIAAALEAAGDRAGLARDLGRVQLVESEALPSPAPHTTNDERSLDLADEASWSDLLR